MDKLNILHSLNIIIHISAGTIALLLGLAALLTKKGFQKHKKIGMLFLLFLTIVVLSGLIGVFVFGRNTFLLVITVLSAYQGFSGYRTLQTKSNQPKFLDIIVAIISTISIFYFLYYFKSIGKIWSPVIIYSTVGALLFLVTYDFARYFIPKSKYQNLWLYEHIYKMIGAFTALLAAFAGTVFAKYQPLSQILPSALGILLQIGFIVYYIRNKNRIQQIKISS
ncbi:MAG: hypothetical protein ABI472_24660 [Ginsengibacter sp.]